jgi:hypothetical protein
LLTFSISLTPARTSPPGNVSDVLKLTFADGTTKEIEVERGRADEEFEDSREERAANPDAQWEYLARNLDQVSRFPCALR